MPNSGEHTPAPWRAERGGEGGPWIISGPGLHRLAILEKARLQREADWCRQLAAMHDNPDLNIAAACLEDAIEALEQGDDIRAADLIYRASRFAAGPRTVGLAGYLYNLSNHIMGGG